MNMVFLCPRPVAFTCMKVFTLHPACSHDTCSPCEPSSQTFEKNETSVFVSIYNKLSVHFEYCIHVQLDP